MKRVNVKRRREGITNYKKRLSLIISGLPRLVVRRSNKHVNCQVINFTTKGDKTLCAFNSKKLNDYEFKGGKNLPSCYLSGYALGMKAKKLGVNSCILDAGLRPSIKGGFLYAVVKGFIEAGVKVPADKNMFPSEDRIQGKHIKEAIVKDMEKAKQKLTQKGGN